MTAKLSLFCFLALLSLAGPGRAGSAALSPMQFLVGNWAGGGDTDAGKARGVSSIKFDLDGRILVRRDHTDLPAAKGHPAAAMETLMLIYPSSTDGRLHATYTDSAGHVIQYTAARVEPGHVVEFDSDPSPRMPAFRLTYTAEGLNALKVSFEMAPPGAVPPTYRPVAVGTLRRIGTRGKLDKKNCLGTLNNLYINSSPIHRRIAANLSRSESPDLPCRP